MSISAAQVKELRERTGLGMMECKAALVESNGDMDAAADLLRKKAGAKVEKRAGRIAADGAVAVAADAGNQRAALVEVNSETDFVAKGEDFLGFVEAIAQTVVDKAPGNVEALSALPLSDSGTTVAQALEALIAKVGEKISLRRFDRLETQTGRIGSYVHGRKIAVLVELEGGSDELARDLAMHIAASRPMFVSKDQVPQELIAKEKEIFAAQAQESGKPPEIIEKMVMGRVSKYLNEISLLGQLFVKDPETTVDKLVKAANGKVVRFVRFEVGEGIDKGPESDFAAEVMAQAKGS